MQRSTSSRSVSFPLSKYKRSKQRMAKGGKTLRRRVNGVTEPDKYTEETKGSEEHSKAYQRYIGGG